MSRNYSKSRTSKHYFPYNQNQNLDNKETYNENFSSKNQRNPERSSNVSSGYRIKRSIYEGTTKSNFNSYKEGGTRTFNSKNLEVPISRIRNPHLQTLDESSSLEENLTVLEPKTKQEFFNKPKKFSGEKKTKNSNNFPRTDDFWPNPIFQHESGTERNLLNFLNSNNTDQNYYKNTLSTESSHSKGIYFKRDYERGVLNGKNNPLKLKEDDELNIDFDEDLAQFLKDLNSESDYTSNSSENQVSPNLNYNEYLKDFQEDSIENDTFKDYSKSNSPNEKINEKNQLNFTKNEPFFEDLYSDLENYSNKNNCDILTPKKKFNYEINHEKLKETLNLIPNCSKSLLEDELDMFPKKRIFIPQSDLIQKELLTKLTDESSNNETKKILELGCKLKSNSEYKEIIKAYLKDYSTFGEHLEFLKEVWLPQIEKNLNKSLSNGNYTQKQNPNIDIERVLKESAEFEQLSTKELLEYILGGKDNSKAVQGFIQSFNEERAKILLKKLEPSISLLAYHKDACYIIQAGIDRFPKFGKLLMKLVKTQLLGMMQDEYASRVLQKMATKKVEGFLEFCEDCFEIQLENFISKLTAVLFTIRFLEKGSPRSREILAKRIISDPKIILDMPFAKRVLVGVIHLMPRSLVKKVYGSLEPLFLQLVDETFGNYLLQKIFTFELKCFYSSLRRPIISQLKHLFCRKSPRLIIFRLLEYDWDGEFSFLVANMLSNSSVEYMTKWVLKRPETVDLYLLAIIKCELGNSRAMLAFLSAKTLSNLKPISKCHQCKFFLKNSSKNDKKFNRNMEMFEICW